MTNIPESALVGVFEMLTERLSQLESQAQSLAEGQARAHAAAHQAARLAAQRTAMVTTESCAHAHFRDAVVGGEIFDRASVHKYGIAEDGELWTFSSPRG